MQQRVDAHRLFLCHLPQGGVGEHHKGGQVLLARKALAHRIQGVEQLFVRLAQAARCGGLCAAGLLPPVGALGGPAAGVLHLQLGFLLGLVESGFFKAIAGIALAGAQCLHPLFAVFIRHCLGGG